MNIQEAQQYLQSNLSSLYDAREAANITGWVMEHLTGWKKVDRVVHKNEALSAGKVKLLEQYTTRLLTHEPVQYVLQEAWFCGMVLYVDEHVLIPRPETEELVEWIVGESQNTEYRIQNSESYASKGGLRILDIGTGSGCIPIALKKQLRAAQVFACDVSKGALGVAKKNALAQETLIEWFQLDFLVEANWEQLPEVNTIVSNPPYIPVKDKDTMHPNVLEHEPHLALFVENNDPLLFYRKIAAFAQQKLLPGGSIYAEIHEDLGESTRQLFLSHGFHHVELKKDMQGKDRMVKATR
jgi:release factor glutamine methyltransferase